MVKGSSVRPGIFEAGVRLVARLTRDFLRTQLSEPVYHTSWKFSTRFITKLHFVGKTLVGAL